MVFLQLQRFDRKLAKNIVWTGFTLRFAVKKFPLPPFSKSLSSQNSLMNPQIFLYYDENHIIYYSENNSKKTSQPSIWPKIIFYPKLWIYSAPNDHLDGGNTFIIVVASRLPNKLNFGWTKKNVCCGSFFAAV